MFSCYTEVIHGSAHLLITGKIRKVGDGRQCQHGQYRSMRDRLYVRQIFKKQTTYLIKLQNIVFQFNNPRLDSAFVEKGGCLCIFQVFLGMGKNVNMVTPMEDCSTYCI